MEDDLLCYFDAALTLLPPAMVWGECGAEEFLKAEEMKVIWQRRKMARTSAPERRSLNEEEKVEAVLRTPYAILYIIFYSILLYFVF